MRRLPYLFLNTSKKLAILFFKKINLNYLHFSTENIGFLFFLPVDRENYSLYSRKFFSKEKINSPYI
tara:strand:+ start:526 stop:726 length:201 start_codon:yes stop_codon:yes gene_type:complete